MNKIQNILQILGLFASSMLFAFPGNAQTKLPEGAYPTILAPHKQTVNYGERTICYDITANVDFTVTSQADWIKVSKATNNNVYVSLAVNAESESRTGNVIFANEANGLQETLVITQLGNQSVTNIPTDTQVKVSSATGTYAMGSDGVEKTIDGDYGTMYHSAYNGSGPTPEITPETPAVLTYNFTGIAQIDYVNYVPRRSGNNGNFKEVEVYVKCAGDADYRLYGSYDWKGSGATSCVYFKEGLKNPTSIKFKVLGGSGGFASCAEMEFFAVNQERAELFSIFTDETCTTLKEGVTKEQVEAIDDDFVRILAQRIFDGTYDQKYRVADYKAFLNPAQLSVMWNTPGKQYNQLEGVTGINFSKGKHAVAVSGIPEGEAASLKVVAWYEGKDGGNFDGGNPQIFTYPLKNGLNVIDYKFDFDGLGYICYYTYNDPKELNSIKVHFINGTVNGYLSYDKSNDEMYQLCVNAKNICMDVVGKKVHSVWTSDGLAKYCKATDGRSLGYRQYINTIDSLVQWEHDLLGFTKYGRIPENSTFAYTNYTYYMFQGGLGVSFHHNQESRVLNCRTITYNDDDAIWGLSHEWGHQHQMHPYFCWGGLGEVSNNMNSYYNIMHMGYHRSDKINNWPPARALFVNLDAKPSSIGTSEVNGETITNRVYASRIANNYSFSPKLKALCEDMAQYTSANEVPTASADKDKALSIHEVDAGKMLCPFIMLYNYATYELGVTDFGPDLYESLRQNDDENGSQIEKKGEVDKYELIASAQNNNKNNKFAVLKSKYPESCWITDGYITESNHGTWQNSAAYVFNFIRKTSRLVGYNLVPYFERWGFLRNVALQIGDYGNKPILMTKEMLDEFKADMDALGLKVFTEQQVLDMSNMRDLNTAEDKWFPTPQIPN